MADGGRGAAAPMAISAAVLIGGGSRRMGEPKALLRLAAGGSTLLELVVAKLRTVATDITLVGRPNWAVPESLGGLRRVDDDGNGAADGLVAALGAACHDYCLVVGCDMPFLDGALLSDMVSLAIREGTGVIAVDAGGPHPLHAVYRRDDLARLTARVVAGDRSLTSIARALALVSVDLAAHERSDAERWSVFNANTPADLATARAHAQQRRSPGA
jgi:molybdenum cofactor guanylyltransferase